ATPSPASFVAAMVYSLITTAYRDALPIGRPNGAFARREPPRHVTTPPCPCARTAAQPVLRAVRRPGSKKFVVAARCLVQSAPEQLEFARRPAVRASRRRARSDRWCHGARRRRAASRSSRADRRGCAGSRRSAAA